MTLRAFDCEQGTPEWLAHRAGVPTSSMFAPVLAKGGKGEDALTRAAYMRRLCGERITGEPAETYSNRHMERGKLQEDDARRFYSMQRDVEVRRVGFLLRDDVRAGASPDGLVDEGLVEIKSKLAHLQILVLDRNEVPREHVAQLHGQLWISARPWVDFVSYCPGLPLFVKRVYRDEKKIAEIAVAVDEFNAELDQLESRIRAMAA